MTVETTTVNMTVAPLRNVALFSELMDRTQGRTHGLPGMSCYSGPSGFGKTQAAIYGANRSRAYHVQVKSVWSRKTLCNEILAEMGLHDAARTIPDMVKVIGSELAMSRRPLIIDEADFLVDKGLIEVVRDIYEGSFAAVILIGEEQLPQKLKKWERVHGRMLDWVQAQPASIADAGHLAKLYCRGITLAPELLAKVHELAAGSARRICVSLDRVREKAQTAGVASIDLPVFLSHGGQFFTGNPPARRT